MPRIQRYSHNAHRSLSRSGLLRGVWIDRLAAADDQLVRFVNRFHSVPGFQHVVSAYFGSDFHQKMARTTIRLAQRLADRNDNFEQTLRFEPTQTFTASGISTRGLKVVLGRTHYVLNTWPRINSATLRQLFRRSVALYHRPDRVRWVFDGGRLNLGKRDVVDEIQRKLNRVQSGVGTGATDRDWLDGLERLIMVV